MAASREDARREDGSLLDMYRDAPPADRAHVRIRRWTTPLGSVADELPTHGRILEVGCGHGLLCMILARASPRRHVVGCDIDHEKIRVARAAASRGGITNVEFQAIEPSDLPRGHYDAVVFAEMLYLLDEGMATDLLVASVGALRPGGRIAILENDTAPRWKHRWSLLQERVAVGLGITQGADIQMRPLSWYVSQLEQLGLTCKKRRLDQGYPYSHGLVVADRPPPDTATPGALHPAPPVTALLSPLPASVLESAIINAESLGGTSILLLECHVGTRIDASRLALAFGRALDRHPMAAARLASGRTFSGDRWLIESPSSTALVAEHDVADITLERIRDRVANLMLPMERLLVRLIVVHAPEGDTLMLAAHHASFDGLGALTLLQTIAAAYDGQDQWSNVPSAIIDRELQARHDVDSASASSQPQRGGWRGHVLALREFVNAPRSTRPVSGVTEAAPGCGITLLTLGPLEMAAMAEARSTGASRNDVLVAALHLTVDRWNEQHGAPADLITVTVPVDIRPRSAEFGLVANATLRTTTTTGPRQRISPAAALAAVNHQMEKLKRDGVAVEPGAVLAAGPWIPRPLRRQLPRIVASLSGERFLDTTRLANLGPVDYDSFPDSFPVTSLWFVPGARMPQGVTMGAVTLAGTTHLSIRWCREMFDEETAERFAELYLGCVRMLGAPGARH